MVLGTDSDQRMHFGYVFIFTVILCTEILQDINLINKDSSFGYVEIALHFLSMMMR